MGVKVLEAGSLTEAKELVVKKTSSTNFSTSSMMTLYVLTTKCWMNASVPTGRHVPAKRKECGNGVDHILRDITRRLLADALGTDGGLGHVELKPGILPEDVLEIILDLERQCGVSAGYQSAQPQSGCVRQEKMTRMRAFQHNPRDRKPHTGGVRNLAEWAV